MAAESCREWVTEKAESETSYMDKENEKGRSWGDKECARNHKKGDSGSATAVHRHMHPCLLFANIVLYWKVIIYGFIQGTVAKLGAYDVDLVSLKTFDLWVGHLEMDSAHSSPTCSRVDWRTCAHSVWL